MTEGREEVGGEGGVGVSKGRREEGGGRREVAVTTCSSQHQRRAAWPAAPCQL